MLYDLIKGALAIAPAKDVRYYLNGVHVVRHDGQTTIEATDGQAIFHAVTPDAFGLPDAFDAVLDREGLAGVLKTHKRTEGVAFNEEYNDLVMVGRVGVQRIADARFPEVQRIISKIDGSRGTTTGINFKLLDKIVKAARAATAGEKIQFGTMRCGDGLEPIEFCLTVGDAKITILQAPARV